MTNKPKTVLSVQCSNGDLLVAPGTEHEHPAAGELVPLALLTTDVPAVLVAPVAFEVPPFVETVRSD